MFNIVTEWYVNLCYRWIDWYAVHPVFLTIGLGCCVAMLIGAIIFGIMAVIAVHRYEKAHAYPMVKS